MSSVLDEWIRREHNPDGTMKPEKRLRLQQRGWSKAEIDQIEQMHIRKAVINCKSHQWQQELERQRAEECTRQEQQQQQRWQQISAMIQRAMVTNQPEMELTYLEGEKVCSDLELLYCIKSGVLTPHQTTWLVQFLVQVLGDTPRNKEFYVNRLNEVINIGSLSSRTLMAIDEKLKQLNITLPPFSVSKGDTVNFEKLSSSEDRRAFAMAGLDYEELLSQGFLEPDDFYNPENDADKEAYQVYERPAYEPPDIPF